MHDKISCLIRNETAPVQIHCVYLCLTVWSRRFHLTPVCNRMAPECGPPRMIQFIECFILLLNPTTECFLTIITMTVSAELVRDMPANYSRMIRITFCQFCVDRSNFLTVYRGSITMVVTETMQIADTLLGYTEHFRVLRGHPSRSHHLV